MVGHCRVSGYGACPVPGCVLVLLLVMVVVMGSHTLVRIMSHAFELHPD